jgi:hypothetical protein
VTWVPRLIRTVASRKALRRSARAAFSWRPAPRAQCSPHNR